ncbi:uncharacterized protein FIBRA_05245 [Fibroporia radiculosa]|uniref:PB1 domain-containing protein n=1 Tax=Fibroporia radiculosa TaxID=599839 RepID=J4H3E3_9APHY|nr:uncharacterized protein FIBRA_05245 [Fibroporia radiculosa]CCM03124.1 predicted protein [Fibroporia radiculosa]
MSTYQIKLYRPPDGLTRKFVDAVPPSWEKLASRIHSLYHIPLVDVAVSYLDVDNDEVTLSSEEEIQDYYRTLVVPPGGEPIYLKFAVHDMGSERNKPLPATPRGSTYRNTFGQSIPMMFEVEDGWQGVASGFGSVFTGQSDPLADDGPHAYVEVIESDIDGSRVQDNQSAVSVADSELTGSTPLAGKGKGKVSKVSSSGSSTESVVSSRRPEKYPIHVMDMNSANVKDVSSTRMSSPTASRGESTRGESTPKASASVASSTSAEAAPDPPLPDLSDTPPTPTPTANLANDVANLFSTLSTVFASHPELSEGVRNLVRNASDGTYWHTHRDAVARAADEIRRSYASSADLRGSARRAAEEAAGRRIAEAIANVVRVIGDVTNNTPRANATSTPRAERDSPGFFREAPPSFSTNNPSSTPASEQRRASGDGSPTPFLAQHVRKDSSRSTFGHGRGFDRGPQVSRKYNDISSLLEAEPAPSLTPCVPPPVPPPPHVAPPPPPPPPLPPRPPSPTPGPNTSSQSASVRQQTLPPGYGSFGRERQAHPVPEWPSHRHYPHPWGPYYYPPPPPPPPPPPHHLGRRMHDRWLRHYRSPSDVWDRPIPVPPPRAEWTGMGLSTDLDIDDLDSPDSSLEHAEISMYGITQSPKESPEKMKESLQTAKELYKAEKEKYRRERVERRKNKERWLNVSGEGAQISTSDDDHPSAAGQRQEVVGSSEPATQIISAARGQFPQLEMYSIPIRRHHTMHGTGYHRTAGPSFAPAVEAITRRLGDMGFTTELYPSIPAQVNARIPRDGELSKDAEDAIVMEVLEILLLRSPVKAPEASGSGTRPAAKDDPIPGAFP